MNKSNLYSAKINLDSYSSVQQI